MHPLKVQAALLCHQGRRQAGQDDPMATGRLAMQKPSAGRLIVSDGVTTWAPQLPWLSFVGATKTVLSAWDMQRPKSGDLLAESIDAIRGPARTGCCRN